MLVLANNLTGSDRSVQNAIKKSRQLVERTVVVGDLGWGQMIIKEHAVYRIGQVIGVKPEQIEAYERIHASVWPEVLAMIHTCNIRNYSIFRHGTLLFAYMEYIGEDFAADMSKMAADPKTREWWTFTDPMQEPLESRAEGEWWATMQEVFHTD